MIRIIFVVFLIFFNAANVWGNNYFQVIKIVDGDTFYIDFNHNGIVDTEEERVRINGIDAFEVTESEKSDRQVKQYNLSQKEILGLGFLGKEFAKKELLNKKVKVEYTAEEKTDKYNRPLVSIYYDCDKGQCKSYEKELLKAGLAVIYPYSNLREELEPYQDIKKIRENALRTKNLDLVLFDRKAGIYQCNKKHYLKIKPSYKSEKLKIYYIDGYKYKAPSKKTRTNAGKALIKEIQNSKESIYFAIYGYSNQPDIENALLNAKNRGVEVRGVVDMTQNNENIYSGTDSFIKKIGNIHNDYQIDDKNARDDFDKVFDITAAIMHNKFFIFDNKKVFTGSTNISHSGTGGYNTNTSIMVDSKEIAQLYTKEFEQMYEGKFHTLKQPATDNKNIEIDKNTKMSVYFAPKDRIFTKELCILLKSAKKNIYIEMFYLTNDYLVNDLISAKKRGVDVKIILDASSANNEFSKHQILRKASIPLKVENWGGKMHTKSAIIDDDYYIIGSMNWTGKAELHNDENLLIIENQKLVLNAKKHYNKLWRTIPDTYLCQTPRAEGTESKYSCFDGLDNDHDGKIDLSDEDCLNCSAKKSRK